METKRNWYEQNREKVRQYQNGRIKNDENAYRQMLLKKREWYARHRDKVLAKQKQACHDKNDSVPKQTPGRKPKRNPDVSSSQSTSGNED